MPLVKIFINLYLIRSKRLWWWLISQIINLLAIIHRSDNVQKVSYWTSTSIGKSDD
jgi:hypothetical protein